MVFKPANSEAFFDLIAAICEESILLIWPAPIPTVELFFAKNNSTVGIGAGQMSRIDSSQIAAIKSKKASELAGLKTNMAEGSVLASDAFFPFADGLIAAAEAGVTSIIQPGGSIRDDEVIDAANKLGLSMVFSGIRHFRH